jgi:hypothetical protein
MLIDQLICSMVRAMERERGMFKRYIAVVVLG